MAEIATERKRMRTGVFAALAIALTAGMASAQGPDGGKPAGPPPALVRVGEVQKQKVGNRWNVVGRLMEVRRATVATEISGRIVAVNAEEGDRVEANKTVLARIDEVWTTMSLRSAEAAQTQAAALIAEAEARIDQAARDLKSLEELQATQSAKPKEVADARSTLAAEQARLEQARAVLENTKTDITRSKERLARVTVLAPFDGVVVRKMTEVGQWSSEGAAVAEIISVGTIDAVIDVPERYINHLARDQDVEIVIEPLAVEMTGKVAAIIPMGSSAARTFPVKIRLADAEGKLMAGMSVTAHVPTGEQVERITVPRDAVQRSSAGDKVWLNLNGQAMPVTVKVLFGIGDRYAVEPLGGGPPLAAGMQVVIEGAERLFPTQPLNIVAATAAR